MPNNRQQKGSTMIAQIANEPLCSHRFEFNPQNNGGEQLSLTTTAYDNRDGTATIRQEIRLESYLNAASFSLVAGSSFTPESLRKLADELEALLSDANAKAKTTAKAQNATDD